MLLVEEVRVATTISIRDGRVDGLSDLRAALGAGRVEGSHHPLPQAELTCAARAEKLDVSRALSVQWPRKQWRRA